MKKQKVSMSAFYCVECGNRGLDIPRPKNKARESGHLKKLYCWYCKKETNHAEIRSKSSYCKEDFDFEFSIGRFVNGERIPLAKLKSCTKSDCECWVEGKCWNANKSKRCEIERDEEYKNHETMHLLRHGW